MGEPWRAKKTNTQEIILNADMYRAEISKLEFENEVVHFYAIFINVFFNYTSSEKR